MSKLSLPVSILICASLACNFLQELPFLPISNPAQDSVPTMEPDPSLTVTSQPRLSSTEPVPPTPGSLASFDPAKVGTIDKDITYCTVTSIDLKMDVYYPNDASQPWPVVVYVHGGAWIKGDKDEGAGRRFLQSLVRANYLVVSVNYRLAPRYPFPAQIEDVKCAIRSLRANADKYNLDPDRIGAMGGSAGGHLVSLLGLTNPSAGFDGGGGYLEQSSRVQAVINMFGPTDITKDCADRVAKQVFGAKNCQDTEPLEKASPVNYVTSDAPPFLFLQGDKDRLVPPEQTRLLHERLVAAGVPSKLVIVENAGHGFTPDGGEIDPSLQELGWIMIDFFNEMLK